MVEPRPRRKGPTYPGHHWGGLAHDPCLELAAGQSAWNAAVKAAWLAHGSAEDVALMFPDDDAPSASRS